MGKVAADETPLSHVDEAELDAELELRVAARKANPRAPEDNPVAKTAGASAEARAARAEQAKKRETRIHGARRKRKKAEAEARDRAFRDTQARAHRDVPPRQSYARRASARARSALHREDPAIAKYYKTLNLTYGAKYPEVKKAYRALMRKYHPDLHTATPKKQKAATELSMRVTQAYNALEEHLKGGPNAGN